MADERAGRRSPTTSPNVPQRVFHVGRLDPDSEGLLLLTNDGGLAHKLMHPSYEVAKTYQVEVAGPVAAGVGRRAEGRHRARGRAGGWSTRSGRRRIRAGALVELVLHEGRNHIVRRMFEAVGYPVPRLIRTRSDRRSGHQRQGTGAAQPAGDRRSPRARHLADLDSPH